jgi:hypothetical protein
MKMIEVENVDIKQIQLDKSNGLYVKISFLDNRGHWEVEDWRPYIQCSRTSRHQEISKEVGSTRVKTILYYIYFETKDCGEAW